MAYVKPFARRFKRPYPIRHTLTAEQQYSAHDQHFRNMRLHDFMYKETATNKRASRTEAFMASPNDIHYSENCVTVFGAEVPIECGTVVVGKTRIHGRIKLKRFRSSFQFCW